MIDFAYLFFYYILVYVSWVPGTHQGQVRSQALKSTYKFTEEPPTKDVLTLTTGVEPTTLQMSQLLTD